MAKTTANLVIQVDDNTLKLLLDKISNLEARIVELETSISISNIPKE